MTAEELWKKSGLTGEYEAWSFGCDTDTLAELVKQGIKTATCSAFCFYEIEDEPMPQVGEYSIVLDSEENAVCIIRTTKVYMTSFNQVTAEHAYKEGEGDRSLDYWRKVHAKFFSEEMDTVGLEFFEDMKVVCEEFEMVYDDKEPQMDITEQGNPRKPQGAYGKLMLEDMNDHHSPVTEWGLSFLRVPEGATLLDIGCGGGATLARLAEMVPDGMLHGIDYSDVSVQESIAHNQVLVDSGRLQVVFGSVEQMPYTDDSFDGITTVESFYFWPDPVESLKEVRRVLKEGGIFLLIADIYGGYDLDEQALENIKKYDLFNPTPEEYKELFRQAGFSDTVVHLKENTSWICIEGRK